MGITHNQTMPYNVYPRDVTARGPDQHLGTIQSKRGPNSVIPPTRPVVGGPKTDETDKAPKQGK